MNQGPPPGKILNRKAHVAKPPFNFIRIQTNSPPKRVVSIIVIIQSDPSLENQSSSIPFAFVFVRPFFCFLCFCFRFLRSHGEGNWILRYSGCQYRRLCLRYKKGLLYQGSELFFCFRTFLEFEIGAKLFWEYLKWKQNANSKPFQLKTQLWCLVGVQNSKC